MLSRTAVPVCRLAVRTPLRSAVRPRIALRSIRQQTRLQSSSAQQAGGGAVAGGVIGGSLVMVAFYGWYHFSGAKTTIDAANSAKSAFNSAKTSFVKATPEPNEALQWLKSTALSYAALLPGGKAAVTKAFDDVDKVREKRGDKVDKIVKKSYDDLKEVVDKGSLDVDTGRRFWNVLETSLVNLAEVAKEAGEDVLEEHPELREKLGGGVQTLQKYADHYGPEAKKAVDDTWAQVAKAVKEGGKGNFDKARKIIDDKVAEIKKLGDDAWKKGMESAKPMLDKNPAVKKIVEQNKDALLKESGNVEEVFEKVKQAVNSGDTNELQKYVQNIVGDFEQKGTAGLQSILDKIPQGKDMGEKFKQLQELAQNKGGDAQKLAEETFKEIREVLQKKLDEGQKLGQQAKEDAKDAAK